MAAADWPYCKMLEHPPQSDATRPTRLPIVWLLGMPQAIVSVVVEGSREGRGTGMLYMRKVCVFVIN